MFRLCFIVALGIAAALSGCETTPPSAPQPQGAAPVVRHEYEKPARADYLPFWEFNSQTDLAREAYRNGDTALAVALFESQLDAWPEHANLHRWLAVLTLETGHFDSALDHLAHYGSLGLLIDLTDPRFDPLRDRAKFRALKPVFARNTAPRATSRVAFRISPDIHLIESIVRNPRADDFFVGAVVGRGIWRVAPDGTAQPFARGAADLGSVFGMATDLDENLLWAASGVVDQTPVAPGETPFRGLIGFDLTTGAAVTRVPAPGPDVGFGDLAMDSCGTLYAADGQYGGVYRLRKGRLERFISPAVLRSPQGMAPDEVRGLLYIADYALGIVVYEFATGNISALVMPPGVTTVGTDGLNRVGNRLYAIQNGVRPNRLMVLTLSADGYSVSEAKVLDAGHPAHDEPTLGTAADGQFYYVANSRWPAWGSGGEAEDPARTRLPTKILSLKTGPADDPAPRCRGFE